MDKTFAPSSSGWLFLTAVAFCLRAANGKRSKIVWARETELPFHPWRWSVQVRVEAHWQVHVEKLGLFEACIWFVDK
ncbi:unnamed protein product [Caretta caretta]